MTEAFVVTNETPFDAVISGDDLPWSEVSWWVTAVALVAEDSMVIPTAVGAFGAPADWAG